MLLAGLCESMDEVAKIPGTTKPVINSNWYSQLYHGLTPDVEIKEYYLSQKSRLFYYIDDAFKTIHCVSIKNAHIETGKTKR